MNFRATTRDSLSEPTKKKIRAIVALAVLSLPGPALTTVGLGLLLKPFPPLETLSYHEFKVGRAVLDTVRGRRALRRPYRLYIDAANLPVQIVFDKPPWIWKLQNTLRHDSTLRVWYAPSSRKLRNQEWIRGKRIYQIGTSSSLVMPYELFRSDHRDAARRFLIIGFSFWCLFALAFWVFVNDYIGMKNFKGWLAPKLRHVKDAFHLSRNLDD